MPTNVLKRTKKGTLSGIFSSTQCVCVGVGEHVPVRKCECICVMIQTRCKPSYKHEELSVGIHLLPWGATRLFSVAHVMLVGPWSSGDSPHLDLQSHCTSTEITDTDYCIELSMGARDINPGLMLAWQARYPASHLPTPLFRTFF